MTFVLGVILARKGSKGIKDKNVRPLGGIPLIGHVGRAIAESKRVNHTIISTDSDSYGKIAQDYGIDYLFKRPPELSTDTASSRDCLIHAVKQYEVIKKTKVDVIVELMCTNPFKTGALIDKVVSEIVDRNHCSAITVTRVEEHHPCRLKTIDDDGFLQDVWTEKLESRRQDLVPIIYIRNGNIYAMTRGFLVDENHRYLPGRSKAVIQIGDSVNLDTMAEWQLAENIFAGNMTR